MNDVALCPEIMSQVCKATSVMLSIMGFFVGWLAGFATHAKIDKIDSTDG